MALQPARFGHCSLVLGQALVVAGGYSSQYLATVEALGQDLAWQALPGLTTARSGHSCAAMGGSLVVAGGVGEGGPTAQVEVLAEGSGQWQLMDSLPSPR